MTTQERLDLARLCIEKISQDLRIVPLPGQPWFQSINILGEHIFDHIRAHRFLADLVSFLVVDVLRSLHIDPAFGADEGANTIGFGRQEPEGDSPVGQPLGVIVPGGGPSRRRRGWGLGREAALRSSRAGRGSGAQGARRFHGGLG
jgi:hypothetical protein